MEKNRVTVTIFGKEYSILSEVNPEYIKKAAAYLDSKMREVSTSYPNMVESRIAVLAALNIADELFKSREERGDSSDIEKQIFDLTRKLSEAL
jgi:cell division protein ZapA